MVQVMTVPLTQLIYCSELAEPARGPRAVDRLLEHGRARNATAGVTGVLVIDDGHVLQVLEGPRDALTALFVRISADDRHRNVQLISVSDLDVRSFPDWALGYLPQTASLGAVLRTYLGCRDFDPASAPATRLRAMVPHLLAPNEPAA